MSPKSPVLQAFATLRDHVTQTIYELRRGHPAQDHVVREEVLGLSEYLQRFPFGPQEAAGAVDLVEPPSDKRASTQESLTLTQQTQILAHLTPSRDDISQLYVPISKTTEANETTCHSADQVAVAHDKQDNVIRLLPSLEQWQDFPKLLRTAKSLGVETTGVFKILVPEGARGREPEHSFSYSNIPCCSYRVKKAGGIFRIFRGDGNSKLSSTPDCGNSSSVDACATGDPLTSFENMLLHTSKVIDIRYCNDQDAADAESRRTLGLPTHSPISHLANLLDNRLSMTKGKVIGIHTPYNYKSGPAFGAPFAMHVEDWNLFSVNYLHRGEKTIIVIPPMFCSQLEKECRRNSTFAKKFKCSQMLRHAAMWIPTATLQSWGIPFVVVRQTPGEVFVTMENAAHQGFSHGITDAEAINYADETWTTDHYRQCNPNCKGEPLGKALLEVEERESSEGESLPEEVLANQHVLARSRKRKREHTRSGINCHVAVARNSDLHLEPSLGLFPATLNNDDDEFLQNVKLPKNSYTPLQIQHKLIEKSPNITPSSLAVLCRLFYSIGCPSALCQLRLTCTQHQEKATTSGQANNPINFAAHCQTNVILASEHRSSDMQILDCLEVSSSQMLVLHRYYMARLVTRRKAFENRNETMPLREQKPKRLRSKTSSRGVGLAAIRGRPRSTTLDHILEEDYLDHKIATAQTRALRRKKLQNRLNHGWNWFCLSQKFGVGILAAIPTTGSMYIPNSSIEPIAADYFTAFVDILVKLRGNFLSPLGYKLEHIYEAILDISDSKHYEFEEVDHNVTEKQEWNSLTLLKYCELKQTGRVESLD